MRRGTRWRTVRRRWLGTLVATLASVGVLATAPPAGAQGVPTPESFFGFEMGTTGRLAGFEQVKQYFRLVANASDRVEYRVVDTTTLGNDYPVLFVSSPRNLVNLRRYVELNRRLAEPRGLEPEEARELAQRSKPIYMIEATLHSTEVGNLPAVVDAVHRFATERSEYTREVLDNAVLMIIPSANPDGQHLVVDYFNETSATEYARVYPDLYHKYVGHDNNRDWFMFTQRESRTRVRLEQTYRPVAAHLMHQAGVNSPRIWTPPYDEPLSRDVDPIAIQSANALGAQVGRGLVAEGLTGVQWDDAYGIFWNADVAGFHTFLGTSLFLTEIASARELAYPYSRPDGAPLGSQQRSINFPEPYRGTTWTLEQIVQYAKTALYAGAESVAKNASSWLYNNLYRVNRRSLTWDEGPYAYVLPAHQRDPYALYELLGIFEFGEVEIDQATSSFTAGGETYPAGSYVLRTQQPLGRWVDQLLKVEPYPESARDCATCPVTLPYSETTDNLGMLLGVDVDAVEAPFEASVRRVAEVAPQRSALPAAPPADGAYLVEPDSYGVAHVLARLQEADVPVFRTGAAVTVAGRELAPGTVVVAPSARARATLAEVAEATGLEVDAVEHAPRVEGFQLKPGTRVGLVRGANNMPGGWLMWMLERYAIEHEVVSATDYAGDGLRERYDTILLADGVSRRTIVEGLDAARYPARFHWARGVGEAGWAALRRFVQEGGNLVAIGSASQTARDLLDLPIENAAPSDRSRFRVPGALLHADYDATQPAAWGMPARWPVWFDDDLAYRVTGPGARVASSYPAEGELLAAGYAQGTEALRGLANVVSFDVGRGHATIAGSQITFRSWPRATWTVVANALYHGPSTRVTPTAMRALTVRARR